MTYKKVCSQVLIILIACAPFGAVVPSKEATFEYVKNCVIAYIQDLPCDQSFLNDFYQKYNQFEDVQDWNKMQSIFSATKKECEKQGWMNNKAVVLMFRYDGYYFVYLSLSIGSLRLSLNQRPIMSSTYLGYARLMMFSEKGAFIMGWADQ